MEELKPEAAAPEAKVPNEAIKDEPKPGTGQPRPPRQPEVLRPVQQHSRFEKTIGVLKTILPLAQKVLPLIDGQIGTVVSNLIAPPASPRLVAQSMQPLEDGLAQLERQQVELRTQFAGQGARLEQIDKQISTVRELAEATAAEQQNLARDLKKLGRKVNIVAIAGLILLAAIVALNVALLVQKR